MISKFNGQFNKAVCNISIKVQSDGRSDPIVDVWWDQFETIDDFLIQGRVKVPENTHDDAHRKDLLRFTLDGSNVFGKGHANVLVKVFMDSFVNNLDFEPTLPLQKVRLTKSDDAKYLIIILKINYFLGSAQN